MLQHAEMTPHGWCLRWDWALLVPTIVADAFIAFAYFAIPLALYVYLRRVGMVSPLRTRLILAFATFILTCGLTHIMDIVVVFYPWYWTNAIIRVICAAASVLTAILLWPALPFLVRGINHVQTHH